jgi:hypothetical protein
MVALHEILHPRPGTALRLAVQRAAENSAGNAVKRRTVLKTLAIFVGLGIVIFLAILALSGQFDQIF